LAEVWLPKIPSWLVNLQRSGYPRVTMIELLKVLGGSLAGLFRSRVAREAQIAFLGQHVRMGYSIGTAAALIIG